MVTLVTSNLVIDATRARANVDNREKRHKRHPSFERLVSRRVRQGCAGGTTGDGVA